MTTGPTWASVLAASAVEPVAQVALGSTLPMLVFRVCHYLIWHVLWGRARQELLF